MRFWVQAVGCILDPKLARRAAFGLFGCEFLAGLNCFRSNVDALGHSFPGSLLRVLAWGSLVSALLWDHFAGIELMVQVTLWPPTLSPNPESLYTLNRANRLYL